MRLYRWVVLLLSKPTSRAKERALYRTILVYLEAGD